MDELNFNKFKLVDEYMGWNILEYENEFYIIQDMKNLKYFYYVFENIHQAKRQIKWMVKHNG